MESDDRLIFLMSKVYQQMMIALKKSLRREGLDVTPAQALLLFFLKKNNGSSLTQLSRGVMIENSTVTGLIDRLEKSGCVERKKSNDDRRVYLIHITEKGNLTAKRSLPLIKKINEGIKEGYSGEEIKAFKKVLTGNFHKFNQENR
ncbi:MAG: MarR family transcriptional regulator [Thermodesulfobacteriota bacterium]|nr:MarR family transcriptional regulator [Thermodesulfobacteriota bacterium]